MNRLMAVTRTNCAGKILSLSRVLVAMGCCLHFAAPASPQIVHLPVLEQFQTQDQRFSCTLEYVPEKCARDLQRLKRLLEGYVAEGPGEWQWVLVARFEWKPFCVKLGVDSVSPAMTSFVDHETFLDEALFEFDPVRAGEFVRKYGVAWKDLLPLAVTHELGHAICRDVTEERAEYYAEEIRRHRPGRCDSSAAPVWTFRAVVPRR